MRLVERHTLAQTAPDSAAASEPLPSARALQGLVDDGLRNLLLSLIPESERAANDAHAQSDPLLDSRRFSPRPSHFNWNLFEATEPTDLAPSLQEKGVSSIAQGLLDWLETTPDDLDSDEGDDERSDPGDDVEHGLDSEMNGNVYGQ